MEILLHVHALGMEPILPTKDNLNVFVCEWFRLKTVLHCLMHHSVNFFSRAENQTIICESNGRAACT